MSKDKKMTVSEWDALEGEKRAALESAKSKIETLKMRRGEMLLLIADGDEKAGRRELEVIEKEIKETDIEIESLLSLLIAIPNRRNLARAVAVESTINEIQTLDARLAELSPKIDAACENFALVVREYFDTLDMLYQINPHSFNFRGVGINILDAISFFLHKNSVWERLKIGKFRDYQTMSSNYRVGKIILGTVNVMRDYVGELRGGEKLNPDICPKCYGPLQYADPRSDKRRCAQCGAVEGNHERPTNAPARPS